MPLDFGQRLRMMRDATICRKEFKLRQAFVGIGRPSRSAAMKRRLVVLAATTVTALAWAGVASAGYAVGPASGSTTSSRPTFEVYLGADEVLNARVYVAANTQMDQYFIPVSELGSCTPSTPSGSANQYTCQPSYYSNANYGPTLPPGTYVWWLSYWHTDPGAFFPTLRISGPLSFTVPQPVAPSSTYLISPTDGATVSSPLTFRINTPAQATMHIYVGLTSDRQADGSPLGLTVYSCSGQTTDAGAYYCTDQTSTTDFIAGSTYYWWAVITVGDASWVYGPRSFSLSSGSSGGSGGGGSGSGSGSGGGTRTRTLQDAPYLPSAARYTGRSVKQTRLSAAAYTLSKFMGAPKSIAIACWSTADWPSVSGDNPMTNGSYSTLAFWTPLMPHWVSLSPRVCGSMETLLHNRPAYPNRFTAGAVETVTHEMMHALGVDRSHFGAEAEPRAECYGMQLSIVLAIELGVPYGYANRLSKYNLTNYRLRPPSYQDPLRCRENGAWDLYPNTLSPPWHSFAL
jgi:uncharacterized membrane protein YgcG